jgi:hypothetical protein
LHTKATFCSAKALVRIGLNWLNQQAIVLTAPILLPAFPGGQLSCPAPEVGFLLGEVASCVE